MSTEEWLQKVLRIIMESDSEEKTELMLKFAKIAADLGYKLCFDDEEQQLNLGLKESIWKLKL